MMKRRPKQRLSDDEKRAAEEFISGAEDPPSTAKRASGEERTREPYPWEEPQVRQDVKQTYPLRLPEPLHLKLKFISEKTGKSMNELCNMAVRTLVEDRMDELTETERQP